MTVSRGIGSLAHAGHAGVLGASRSPSGSGASFDARVSPPAPLNPFEENQRRLAEVKRASVYYDSRIERWCRHTGQDPELCRLALQAGYTVRFSTERRGHRVLLHVVKPGEVG